MADPEIHGPRTCPKLRFRSAEFGMPRDSVRCPLSAIAGPDRQKMKPRVNRLQFRGMHPCLQSTVRDARAPLPSVRPSRRIPTRQQLANPTQPVPFGCVCRASHCPGAFPTRMSCWMPVLLQIDNRGGGARNSRGRRQPHGASPIPNRVFREVLQRSGETGNLVDAARCAQRARDRCEPREFPTSSLSGSHDPHCRSLRNPAWTIVWF